MSLRNGPTTALLLALAAGCGGAGDVTVRDLAGAPHAPLATADGVQVFVVTSHECPIANAYAPVLGELAAAWRDEPVALYVVHAGPDLTPDAARRHAAEHRLPGTILLDPHHRLIAALGATRTPEAVVRAGGAFVYRGRIDDRWQALGARAQAASVHDLRDAVAAALAGRPAAVARTEVVGCQLPEPRR